MLRIFSLIVLLAFISCEDKFQEVGTADPGFGYFPLTTGLYWTYLATDVTYNSQGPDTSVFFLRQSVTDSLVTDDGTVTYVLTLEQAEDTLNADWQPYKTWSARRTANHAVVTEENIPYIKLSFPMEDGKSWDGNALNARAEALYRLELFPVNVPFSGLEQAANEAMRVIIADVEPNLVEQDQRYEVYIEGIGLIEKSYTALQFCTVNCSSTQEIESGFIWSQYLVEYGKN